MINSQSKSELVSAVMLHYIVVLPSTKNEAESVSTQMKIHKCEV